MGGLCKRGNIGVKYGLIFGRTILIYFVVFLVLRIMGKREIGKLSVFDLVISIMIAEMAVFVLDDLKKPLAEGLLPLVFLVIIQITMAYITLKSRKLRLLFDGKPSYLIENGKINRREMKKQRYSIDDLLLQLRENQVRSISEVEVALLETNGKLSVIIKQTDEEKDKLFDGLPLSLIMDGEVLDDNLARIGKDRLWLELEIAKRGFDDFGEVFFCSIAPDGALFINEN